MDLINSHTKKRGGLPNLSKFIVIALVVGFASRSMTLVDKSMMGVVSTGKGNKTDMGCATSATRSLENEKVYSENDSKKTAVIIFTHLISAHPSIDPLLTIYNGTRKYLSGLPENAPYYITVDGIKAVPEDTKGELFLMESQGNRDKYHAYIHNLQVYFKDHENVKILVAGKNLGLANNIRRVIQYLSADTKYMYLFQHDLPLIKEINHTDILMNAELYPKMRLVGFKGEHSINNVCGDDIASPSGIFYRRFKLWTDRNHFARVDHYRDDILPMVTSDFPEDNMHRTTRINCTYFGPYYYQAGKGDPYYDHTDASERYGNKLAERVKRGELPYSSLTEINLKVMRDDGVNMTELEHYNTVSIDENKCQSTEPGSDIIFTSDISTFPHAPEFTPVFTLFPTYDESKAPSEIACWYNCPMHHPHFVQTMLRCFSLWENRPSEEPRVLYVPKQQFWGKLGNPENFDKLFPISSAILRTVKEKYQVRVTNAFDAGNSYKPQGFLEMDNVVSPFAMASREDATKWRELFVPPPEEPGTRRKKERLKIAVINRPKGRRLLNEMDVKDNIQAAFLGHDVSVYYIHNMTMQEMADFYRQVDILVSPHGSQLTGTMFMQKCSAVLELFPQLYYTPFYFSSLARIFELPHAMWYVANDPVPTFLDLQTRLANTENNMCPSMDKLVSAVTDLIKRRQDCLDALQI